MAAKSQSKAAICPLFPGVEPPVLAEDCHRFEVHVLLGSRTGSGVPGVEIDLEDAEFTRANNGEAYSIDPYKTTTLELANILKVRELDREAGEVPFYRVDAFVDGNNKPIGTHRLAVKARYSDEFQENVSEEDEEKKKKDQMPVMYPQEAAMRMNSDMMKMLERTRTEPLQMLVAMKQLSAGDGDAMKMLQEEVRAIRTRHEEELRQARVQRDTDVAAKDREVTRLQDDLRLERQRSEDREKALRDENRDIRKRSDDDIRAVRDRAEKELDSYRKEASEKIFDLQKTVLSLQTDSQKELLKKSEELMQERMKAALAQREVEDQAMALQSAEETLGEQLKGAAAGMEELNPLVKMFLPFVPKLIEKFVASGQPLPVGQQQVQELVDRIQIPPVQTSYMPPASPPQEPAVRTQQPTVNVQSAPTPEPEPEEPDESDDEDSDEDESDSEENAAE